MWRWGTSPFPPSVLLFLNRTSQLLVPLLAFLLLFLVWCCLLSDSILPPSCKDPHDLMEILLESRTVFPRSWTSPTYCFTKGCALNKCVSWNPCVYMQVSRWWHWEVGSLRGMHIRKEPWRAAGLFHLVGTLRRGCFILETISHQTLSALILDLVPSSTARKECHLQDTQCMVFCYSDLSLLIRHVSQQSHRFED